MPRRRGLGTARKSLMRPSHFCGRRAFKRAFSFEYLVLPMLAIAVSRLRARFWATLFSVALGWLRTRLWWTFSELALLWASIKSEVDWPFCDLTRAAIYGNYQYLAFALIKRVVDIPWVLTLCAGALFKGSSVSSPAVRPLSFNPIMSTASQDVSKRVSTLRKTIYLPQKHLSILGPMFSAPQLEWTRSVLPHYQCGRALRECLPDAKPPFLVLQAGYVAIKVSEALNWDRRLRRKRKEEGERVAL